MKAVIVSNGNISDYEFAKKQCIGRYVICADGAIIHCINMGIVPDVWIGDMDSCTISDDMFLQATQGSHLIKLNVEKDMTDTEYCCDYAAQCGYKDIVIIGATGTRLDHTIANIYMLKRMSDRGVNAVIADQNNTIFVAQRHNIIQKGNFDYVSVLPMSNIVSGISNKGLYYAQENDELCKYSSKGVSNRLVDDCAAIEIKNGDALIILSKD